MNLRDKFETVNICFLKMVENGNGNDNDNDNDNEIVLLGQKKPSKISNIVDILIMLIMLVINILVCREDSISAL